MPMRGTVITIAPQAGITLDYAQSSFISENHIRSRQLRAMTFGTFRPSARHLAKRTISKGDAAGSWTQAVYQVDDSPRYGSFGRWQHADGVSTWIGGQTWRPLPRREWSVRKDYDVLIGTNRYTITARGWVQEENHLKAVSKAPGALRASQFYLAREYGVARYDRIKNFDFSAGDRYFERTGPFWDAVREAWEQRFATTGRITLKRRSTRQIFSSRCSSGPKAGKRQTDRFRRTSSLHRQGTRLHDPDGCIA